MSHGQHHDPVARVNEEHAEDLLAVARVFGGQPDATSARTERVGRDGIDLVVTTCRGTAAVHVAFDEKATSSAGGLRKAFLDLSRQARAALAIGSNERSGS